MIVFKMAWLWLQARFIYWRVRRKLDALPPHKRRWALAEIQRIMEEE